jgi:hypothetical protein
MAAHAHLNLRLAAGDSLTLGDRTLTLGADDAHGLCVEVAAGQTLQTPRCRLTCLDAPWTFRWPLVTRDPYHLLQPNERLGNCEVALYPAVYGFGDPAKEGRLSATFRLAL